MLPKKHFLICVALCICFLLASGHLLADTFVLSGNYLQVGISESGGLIDDNFSAGIKFDPGGTGNYTIHDFLTPGAPFEFYSIGINGTYEGTAGYNNNAFGLTTKNVSSGNTLAAISYGIYQSSAGPLLISQLVYFDVNSKDIGFSVQFVNLSPSPMNIVYARGLDPDQDYNSHGVFETINTIPSPNTVKAVGQYSGYAISIVDLTGFGIPSVDYNWDTNPYNLLIPHNDGNGDNAINMAWDLGQIDPGRSKEIDFKYSVNVVPVPASLLLLGSGLLSLGGFYRRKQKN